MQTEFRNNLTNVTLDILKSLGNISGELGLDKGHTGENLFKKFSTSKNGSAN